MGMPASPIHNESRATTTSEGLIETSFRADADGEVSSSSTPGSITPSMVHPVSTRNSLSQPVQWTTVDRRSRKNRIRKPPVVASSSSRAQFSLYPRAHTDNTCRVNRASHLQTSTASVSKPTRPSWRCINCTSTDKPCPQCPPQRTSYGVLMFRRNMNVPDGVEYLMICREHTYGYTECIRARFDISDRSYVGRLMHVMTPRERVKIATYSFRELWKDLWQDTYWAVDRRAEHKFNILRKSQMFQSALQSASTSIWTCAEWGFPKGKPNWLESEGVFEDGQTCAQRELAEETGIHCRYAYKILGKKSGFFNDATRDVRVTEIYKSIDNRWYKHVYFIAEYVADVPTAVPFERDVSPPVPNTRTMQRAEQLGGRSVFHNPRVPRVTPHNSEVSAVEWCSYKACCEAIRPYNTAKLQMLQNMHPYVCRYNNRQRKRTPAQANAPATTTAAVTDDA